MQILESLKWAKFGIIVPMEELRSEEGITRADEVADLDPYNVRTSPQEVAAEELLKVKQEKRRRKSKPKEEKEEQTDLESQYREREKKDWKKVLGIDIDIKPFPVDEKGNQIITQNFLDELKSLDMALIYMPDINTRLSSLSYRQGRSIPKFLNSYFPNWKPIEELTDQQAQVASNYRNVNKDTWEEVGKGNIDEPNLPGQWMAIELNPDTSWTYNSYRAPLNRILGVSNRVSTFNEAEKIIKDASMELFDVYLKIPEDSAEFRLPNFLETNLYLNRLQQRPTLREWTTSTHRISLGRTRKLVMRSPDFPKDASPDKSEVDYGDIQFRTLIAFK